MGERAISMHRGFVILTLSMLLPHVVTSSNGFRRRNDLAPKTLFKQVRHQIEEINGPDERLNVPAVLFENGNASDSAMVIRMTSAGLQEMAEKLGAKMISYLQLEKMENISVPTQTGMLNITNIKLYQVKAKFYHYTNPPDTLIWGFNDGMATIMGNWIYVPLPKTIFREKSTNIVGPVEGTFRVQILGSAANISYSLSQSRNGFPMPKDIHCGAIYGKVKFITLGTLMFSKQYNTASDLKMIMPNYSDLICAASRIYIYDAYSRLEKNYEPIISLDPLSMLQLNATVTGDPLIEKDWMDIPLKGIVINKQRMRNFQKHCNAQSSVGKFSKQIFLNADLLNSLFSSGFNSGLMSAFSISFVINGVSVSVATQVVAPPKVTISTTATAKTDGAIYAVDVLNPATALFQSNFDLKLKIIRNSIQVSVGGVTVQVTSLNSWPGLINSTYLEQIAAKGVTEIMKKFLSTYYIPIPQMKGTKWFYGQPVIVDGTFMTGAKFLSISV